MPDHAGHGPGRPTPTPPTRLAYRTPGENSLVRASRILGRAVWRRCPNCGGTDVFRTYLQPRVACPDCGLRFDRGERDFFIGAYTINLIVAELVVVFGGLAVAMSTWPDVPWTALTWGLAALMVIVPILLYPYSRQLWLGFDLIFQPPRVSDFDDHVDSSERGISRGTADVDNRPNET
jgi:uncharacterized protein (DUF983 family)